MTQKTEDKYGLSAMSWYGWGSPVGLGLLVLLLALAFWVGSMALQNLANTGKTGLELKQQEMMLDRVEK